MNGWSKGGRDGCEGRTNVLCVFSVIQLQQQTQSQCCCLLLVSEDNHQLFCQVCTQRHRQTVVILTVKIQSNFNLFKLQVVGDKVLEEEISFPVRSKLSNRSMLL